MWEHCNNDSSPKQLQCFYVILQLFIWSNDARLDLELFFNFKYASGNIIFQRSLIINRLNKKLTDLFFLLKLFSTIKKERNIL